MNCYLLQSVKRESKLTKNHFPFEIIHNGMPINSMSIFHWHEFLEISYIEEGEGVYEIEDKLFPVKKGDIVIINGIERHRVTYQEGNSLYETVIHFDPELIWSKEDLAMNNGYMKLFSKGANFINRPKLDDDEQNLLAQLISDIVIESNYKKPYYQHVIKSKLLLLIAYLLRQGGTRPVNEIEVVLKRNNIERIEKILEYIHENYKDRISLEQVARAFYMNSSYFSEYFKKNMGINFLDYLVKIRINEAIKMLQDNRLNTTEIAYNCGFNNISSFYNAFKKITGTNPGKYSQKNVFA